MARMTHRKVRLTYATKKQFLARWAHTQIGRDSNSTPNKYTHMYSEDASMLPCNDEPNTERPRNEPCEISID
jgi:hypothetical protein